MHSTSSQDEKQGHPGQEQSKPEQARPQQHAQQQQRSDQNKQHSMPSDSASRIKTSHNSMLNNVNGRNLVNISGMWSRRPGKSIVHEASSRTTATGSSEADTTAIAFQTTAIEDI